MGAMGAMGAIVRYKLIDEKYLYILDSLTEKEKKVLELRLGINCNKHTFHEISIFFNTTPERIRQIEDKALRKLMHQSRRIIDSEGNERVIFDWI